ncbi:hypothetical protein NP233_g762 [Leucocoprinus birnbaumii]|uniref:Uncharacterized protein n=1 Tax=Leucocoprinus birnbaumii TaxID=56174 RepID=A0AAD5Z040_9AGAR|nr:hypothetical protein NP233_g762 [Leucocoprinus birnbaumii]
MNQRRLALVTLTQIDAPNMGTLWHSITKLRGVVYTLFVNSTEFDGSCHHFGSDVHSIEAGSTFRKALGTSATNVGYGPTHRALAIFDIVASYTAIWSSRISVSLLILGAGCYGSLGTAVFSRCRVCGVYLHVLLYACLWAGIMFQNIMACTFVAYDSICAHCSLSKSIGVSHIIVYLVATMWLGYLAHRALYIQWNMDGLKWRVLGTSVGGDLLCTLISIVRGVAIVRGKPMIIVVFGALEVGIAIPIANMLIVVPRLCNLCHNRLERTPSRSPSPVIFRGPTMSNETVPKGGNFEVILEVPGEIELLPLPSMGTPTALLAGSTSSLIPRVT